jgi:hypothetical protein
VNKRILYTVLLTGTVSLVLGGVAAPGAWANEGKKKVEVSTTGKGTLGSPWTLKSALDDANGVLTVGEEFEINTSANTPPDAVGQPWTVTFAQNGVVFLDDTQNTQPTGIREAKMTPRLTEPLHMTVHAVNLVTGETIDGAVTVP